MLSITSLKRLVITDINDISEIKFKEIVQYMGNIEDLDWSGNENITDSVIYLIAEKCINLKRFVIARTDVTDDGLNSVTSTLESKLKYLDISESRITEENTVTSIDSCKSLEYLGVRDMHPLFKDEAMSLLRTKIPIVDCTSNDRDCDCSLCVA